LSNNNFERYLQTVRLSELLKKLGVKNVKALTEQIKHFTEKEAERRNEILLSYFGAEGVQRIVTSIVNRLLSPPMLVRNAKILDMGAGTGFFTIKIAQRLWKALPQTRVYAMDITPAMLRVLTRKRKSITPFLGIAENISASIRLARRYGEIPEKFDAVCSTLTLHHCRDIEKVFQSIHEVVEKGGKVVIVDLCKHSFKEFRREMGDLHLGFSLEEIQKKASRHFEKVEIEKMSGIRCECSGRSTELFLAHMTG
jgi:SAM-dependent methyltransferase